LLGGFGPLATPGLATEPDMEADEDSGNLYVANGAQLLGYSAVPAPLPSPFPIAAPGGNGNEWKAVAVDVEGRVWGADFRGVVHELSPSGAELNPPGLDLSGSAALAGKAVRSLDLDAHGDLYLAGNNGVWKLPAPAYDSPVEVDPAPAAAIAVDRSSGDLYVAHEGEIERYGPDGGLIENFPATASGSNFKGIAVDEASKDVYAYDRGTNRIFAFKALTLPDLNTGPLGDLTETSATLHGTVSPDGLALSGCKFEWVSEAAFNESGFSNPAPVHEHECEPPFGSIPTSGESAVSAPATGLTVGTRYRFRLSASNENGTNSSASVPFALAKPGVETVGSPIRTATTARLDSRIDPHGIPTEYHFEYIPGAAYQANLGAGHEGFQGAESSTTEAAGAGGLVVLASAELEGLSPATTYHYRAIADNGAFGGPATGLGRTLTTRATDSPPSHGPYPGPAGSDRAWEQVNLPDTGGNPVQGAAGIATGGDAAVYRVFGGTPVSEGGTLYDYLFARRAPNGPDGHPAEGWRTESVYPTRTQAPFSNWFPPSGDEGLSTLLAVNVAGGAGGGFAVWRIPTADGAPAKIYEAPSEANGHFFAFSEDGSRALMLLTGKHLDPAHESPGGVSQLYDVSSGTPQMVLLPGNKVPTCGTSTGQSLFSLHVNWTARPTHWISADGKRAFFPNSCEAGTPHLYMRDSEAGTATRVDGPPPATLSGPLGPDCPGAMIRSTPSALYLWTQSRLAEGDTAIAGACASSPDEFTEGGDVYRYALAAGEYQCLTCVAPGGRAANVIPGTGAEGAARAIAVAPKGPRLYFTTRSQLLPGAAEGGTPAIYLLDTETDQLAYVGPVGVGDRVGEDPGGNFDHEGTAISPDGRFLVFRSAAAGLDQLTDSDNGNTSQDYLYDDAERSLVCVSCPADGSAPRGPAAKGVQGIETELGPGLTSVAGEGSGEFAGAFAFATPTALVGADQNTAAAGQPLFAGQDVYEWRDGRALLVSDGLTGWPGEEVAPTVDAISPDGRNVFFTEAAQLTPDAIDGYKRLYDARVGGGIDFPEEPKPCALDVCQGTLQGTPEEASPGSGSFQGAGNEAPQAFPRKPPHKHKKHRRHHRPKPKRGGGR
jgi:hypothetical protein